MRACQDAVRIDPTVAAAYVNMGIVFGKLHKLPQARECFEKAIELEPKCAPAYYNLGLVLEESDAEAACRRYQRALALDPNYAAAHNALGMSLLRRGDRRGRSSISSWRCGAIPT